MDLMGIIRQLVANAKTDIKQLKNPDDEYRAKARNLIENMVVASSTAPKSRMMKLPASSLISHEGAPDKARVEFYKKLLTQGKQIEPLKVILESTNKGIKYGVEDGKHRLQALTELGMTKDIPVELMRFWGK